MLNLTSQCKTIKVNLVPVHTSLTWPDPFAHAGHYTVQKDLATQDYVRTLINCESMGSCVHQGTDGHLIHQSLPYSFILKYEIIESEVCLASSCPFAKCSLLTVAAKDVGVNNAI